MADFDLKEWEKTQLVSKYGTLKVEHDCVCRQIDEAQEVIEKLQNVKAECFEKMQSIKKVLLEKYNYPLID